MNELTASNEKRVIANELIPVYETETGDRNVDARELHQFLKVGRDFTHWIKDRIEKFGFVENEDFKLTLVKIGERQNVTRHDYSLTIDTAKELCMVENNEQGSRARKYFIEVEKRFKNQQLDLARLSPELQMFHALFESQAKTQLQLVETQKQLASMTETVETIQDTFLQRDEDWRKHVNSLVAGASYRTKTEYRDMRNESYRLLEERGHCDLDKRLRNLTQRMEDAGATKTQIKNTNKMDVIESDPRLKEIYTTIVKELSIGSLRQVK